MKPILSIFPLTAGSVLAAAEAEAAEPPADLNLRQELLNENLDDISELCHYWSDFAHLKAKF